MKKEFMKTVYFKLCDGFRDKTITYCEESNTIKFQNLCSFYFIDEIDSLMVGFKSDISPETCAVLMQAFVVLFDNKINVGCEEWWDENGFYCGEEARNNYLESIKNS